ncbi:MAG TPA: hypothetical protein VMH05_01020 [Bryobacteraceae bacterium]|nr:hypothetical protein [Bryobacteraceae bacterium]
METPNKTIYRYAMLVAASFLTLIAIGAYVGSRAAAAQLDTRRFLDANVHSGAAVIVGFLAFSLAVRQEGMEAALLSWTSLALFAIEGSIGWLGGRLLHATLAPLVFASMVAVMLVTSAEWKEPPELVDERLFPFLRPLALAGPPLLVLQTLLGASYRHKLTGVLPHLGGAMIVTLTALIAASLVLHRCPSHRPLRAAASWLMAIVLAQVTLGVAAFTMQLLGLASTAALVFATASHVVVGSLTLSASVVFAMQVHRQVRPASAEASRNVAPEVTLTPPAGL